MSCVMTTTHDCSLHMKMILCSATEAEFRRESQRWKFWWAAAELQQSLSRVPSIENALPNYIWLPCHITVSTVSKKHPFSVMRRVKGIRNVIINTTAIVRACTHIQGLWIQLRWTLTKFELSASRKLNMRLSHRSLTLEEKSWKLCEPLWLFFVCSGTWLRC
jgi:hypothetical protein